MKINFIQKFLKYRYLKTMKYKRNKLHVKYRKNIVHFFFAYSALIECNCRTQCLIWLKQKANESWNLTSFNYEKKKSEKGVLTPNSSKTHLQCPLTNVTERLLEISVHNFQLPILLLVVKLASRIPPWLWFVSYHTLWMWDKRLYTVCPKAKI